jgi:5-methylcytosine-specific restriction endonuclease McrA
MDATTLLDAAARLSDDELLARVTALAAREREATVAVVAHLAELDARGLHLAAGYASLFSYCTGALHLSEHAAYHRIQAARAVRRFPVILELLASGALTLTAVTLLAPHLTSANHRELLQAASGRPKREVEVLVASLHPQPPVPAMIRRLPQRPPMTAAAGASGPQSGAALTGAPEANQARLEPGRAPTEPGTAPKAAGQAGPPEAIAGTPAPHPGVRTAQPAVVGSAAPTRSSHPGVVQPLAPERYKIQFTASAVTVAKLRQVQDLLRHQIPDGDLGEVIDRALTALLHQLVQRKAGAVLQPRESADRSHANGEPDGVHRQGDGRPVRAPPPSRHIPASVRRAVWARDGGRCAFVAPDGRRCGETAFLEFHHVRPYARGGPATVENIELRCRAHNA